MVRHSARVDESIPEDLLANIPVMREPETTTFAIEGEEVIAGPAGRHADLAAALSHQLRYELGEALARELDKASDTFSRSIAELEAKMKAAEEAYTREHEARIAAESRLAALRELVLK